MVLKCHRTHSRSRIDSPLVSLAVSINYNETNGCGSGARPVFPTLSLRREDRPFLRLLPPLYVRLNPFLFFSFSFFFPPPLSPDTIASVSSSPFGRVRVRDVSVCGLSQRERGRESKLQLYVAPIFSSFLIPRRFILRQARSLEEVALTPRDRYK